MYVTRPRSLYKSNPADEGPGSGYLVLQGEEDIGNVQSFFGLPMIDESLKYLPFPQNKVLTVNYNYGSGPYGSYTEEHDALFIPVINQPLSSNCYYVMVADDIAGKGLAYSSARAENAESCCFHRTKPYCTPERFNPHNIGQQFEIFQKKSGRFSATSVDPECCPPIFLRRDGWMIHASTKKPKITLGEADGLNSILRSQLPEFDYFPLSTKYSNPKTVGKWYCPYMFIIDGSLKTQMERSMFYELTLEQQWERIHSCEKDEVGGDNSVSVSVVLPTEVVKISWTDAVSETDEANNIVWFSVMSEKGVQTRVGLSMVITERMKWEQERVGWVGRNEKEVMIARTETYTVGDSWKKFGFYVLVERFVLKRLDGSLVLTYEFKHTHNIRCKWE